MVKTPGLQCYDDSFTLVDLHVEFAREGLPSIGEMGFAIQKHFKGTRFLL